MTAEAGARVSSLARYAEKFAAASAQRPEAVRITEVPFLTQISVRLDPKSPLVPTVADVLGAPLPVEPNTVAWPDGAGGRAVLWLGPDEWLVLDEPGGAVAVEEALRSRTETIAGDVSLVDVSAQRTTVDLAGTAARDVLSHGCGIDLHPSVLGVGRCAQTMLAKAGVVLLPVANDPVPAYRILVRASFARYLADWLLDASVEYREGVPVG